MKTVFMVGEERHSDEAWDVYKFIDPERAVWSSYRSSVDDCLDRGDELLVLQFGGLSSGQLDVVDRAIERGVPVLEYK